MNNALSIDLESWVTFHAEALKSEDAGGTSDERRRRDDGYVVDTTARLLELLAAHHQRATFFIVGELYDWYPDLIERIQREGHEIGYHTHSHAVLTNGELLRRELERSEPFLERFKPIGFRAPRIHLTRESFALLREWGFRYSSSTYDRYRVTQIEGIDEVPVSCLFYGHAVDDPLDLPKNLTPKLLMSRIPFGAGVFIALLRSGGTSWLIRRLNRRGMPAVLFVHPWQLYRPKPISCISFRLKVLLKNPLCFPYTWGILGCFERLLTKHRFLPIKDVVYG